MSDINYLQGTGSVSATLNTTPTKTSGLSVSSSPSGDSYTNLQGSSGTSSVPGVTQTSSYPSTSILSSGGASGSWATTPVTDSNVQTISNAVGSHPLLDNYTFGDGNSYNSSGSMTGVASGIQSASLPSGTTNVTPPNVSASTDTNVLSGSPVSNNDIYGLIQNNVNKQNDLINGVVNALSDPAYATAQQNALNSQQEVANFDTSVMGGMADIMKKPIGLDFQQGQSAALNRDAAFTRSSLSNQASYYQNVLTNALTSRNQKIQAMQFLFDATKNQLPQVLSMMQQVAPQNIGTQYNPVTGGLYSIIRNPIDGQVSVTSLGNIGAQKSYTSTNVTTDPMTGGLVFIGTTADGKIEQVPIGSGGASVDLQGGGGGAGGGVQGNFNFNPQQASGLTTPAAINNNPGNLRYTGQEGAAQGQKGFAAFSTPEQGFQALVSDVQAKQSGQNSHGLGPNSTLADFFKVYAPAADNNDPMGYAKTVAQQLGVSANTTIGHIDSVALASAIAQHEDGKYWKALTSGGVTLTSSSLKQSTGLAQIQAQLPSPLRTALRQTTDGVPYILKDQIPSTLTVAANNYAAKLGIPILDKEDVVKLRNIDVTTQNLTQLGNLVSRINPSNFVSRPFGAASNFVEKKIQSNPNIASYNVYRDTAINTIQALAGGSGSGFRLNQAEIDTATANLPTIYDTQATAQKKLGLLQGFLQKWKTELLPNSEQGAVESGADPLGLLSAQ